MREDDAAASPTPSRPPRTGRRDDARRRERPAVSRPRAERLADAGCADVCLVVAPDHAVSWRTTETCGDRVAAIAVQTRVGTADAVLAARRAATRCWSSTPTTCIRSTGPSPCRSRGLRPGRFERRPRRQRRLPGERVASSPCSPTTRMAGRDSREARGRGRLRGRALVSMNLWRFDARIFPACGDVAVRRAANANSRRRWPGSVARRALPRGASVAGRCSTCQPRRCRRASSGLAD